MACVGLTRFPRRAGQTHSYAAIRLSLVSFLNRSNPIMAADAAFRSDTLNIFGSAVYSQGAGLSHQADGSISAANTRFAELINAKPLRQLRIC